jgi:hypothetical protein
MTFWYILNTQERNTRRLNVEKFSIIVHKHFEQLIPPAMCGVICDDGIFFLASDTSEG